MKTTVSKSEIREAVKNLDVKNLYIYSRILKMDVCDVIYSCGCARKLKSDANYEVEKIKHINDVFYGRRKAETKSTTQIKIDIINELKWQFRQGLSQYSKMPLYRNGRLYFCSPAYGLKDYNLSSYVIDDKKFCDKIIMIANKWMSNEKI